MGHPRQSVLIPLVAVLGVVAAISAAGRRFYPDDPIAKEPPPLAVGKLRTGQGSDPAAFLHDTLRQRAAKIPPPPALDVNTIDELPDSAWFTNRHALHPLKAEELALGTDGRHPPAEDQNWTIYEAEQGTSPIIRIQDSKGNRFALRFDPKDHIEASTAADVIGARLFYALGYNVPDDYAVRFPRSRLRAGPGVRFVRDGQRVLLRESDIDHLLSLTPHYPDGAFRALATRIVDGNLLGPFEYSGTRVDDPNDTIPHERRRVLRALFVFSAWIDHVDTRVLGTLDTIQYVDGVRSVRHYLTDFGSSLGGARLRPSEAWEGHTYAVDFRWGLKQMLTLGAYSPKWERDHGSPRPATGSYSGNGFEPALWKPEFPNAAFASLTDADAFWAARQVRAFSDTDLRAIVAEGHYSDPKMTEAVAQAMAERRDNIVAYYSAHALPLDRFEVRDGRLEFRGPQTSNYKISWSRFDNENETKTPLDVPGTFDVPMLSGYLTAEISDGSHTLSVYLHDGRVVGLTRQAGHTLS